LRERERERERETDRKRDIEREREITVTPAVYISSATLVSIWAHFTATLTAPSSVA
jgi:hypothetical protein